MNLVTALVAVVLAVGAVWEPHRSTHRGSK